MGGIKFFSGEVSQTLPFFVIEIKGAEEYLC